jgi:2-hydroxycyclohexanecarboxyl-CoA dehydrogenase
MLDEFRLDAKVSLVTGGGSGIGRAISVGLAEAGADVIVADLSLAAAEDTALLVEKAGRRALPLQVDVTDHDAVRVAVDGAVDEMRRLDILCNNAGVMNTPTKFVNTTTAEWRREIEVIFLGTLNCTHAALPHMLDAGDGRIVNTASDAGRTGEPRTAVYSGAKAAVIGFSKALAKEVARSGIRVNCISPGTTQTPLMESANLTPDQVAAITRLYPLGRLGQPRDHALAVVFLASDASSWITGQTLSVSGGYTMV